MTGPQLEQLVERTEGWAAGLRLVAVHLKAVHDLPAAVEVFSGEDHSVADYLLTEVLDRQAPELVTILETISVVDLVCADLADALTGGHDGARVLADLAAAHLFVQAVGQPGRWYRLHRLISDILRARPVPRRRRRDLHRRAAEWFRSNAMPLEAIRSAVAGELWPLAADLAGTHALTLITAGRGRAVEQMLARIDRTVLGGQPELAGALALARVARGSDAEAAALISVGRAAGGAVSARRAARAQVLLDVSASGLARIAGDSEAAMTALGSLPVAAEALAALGMAGAEIVPVVVANNRGTAALWAADLDGAERYLTAAMHVDMDGLAIPQLNAMAYHCLLQCERGELDPAEAAARRVIDTAAAAGLATAVQSVGAYLTLARVSLDRGGTDEADEWLARIADVQALAPEPHVRLAAAIILATRREAAGDREAALTCLRAQDHPAHWRPPPGLRDRWLTTEAALLARAGDGVAARQLLERMGQPAPQRGRSPRPECICSSATSRRRRPFERTPPRLSTCAAGSPRRCSTPCSPPRPGTSTGRPTTSRTPWPPPRPGHCADLSWPRRRRCGPCSSVASRPEPPCRASRSNCSNGHPTSPGPTPKPGARSSTRSPNVSGPCCATWPARCRMRRSPPSCTCR